MLQDQHANLCRSLASSEIAAELYSNGVILVDQMEAVHSATTTLEKNRLLLQAMRRRDLPVTDLCRVLEKLVPFKEISAQLKAGLLWHNQLAASPLF